MLDKIISKFASHSTNITSETSHLDRLDFVNSMIAKPENNKTLNNKTMQMHPNIDSANQSQSQRVDVKRSSISKINPNYNNQVQMDVAERASSDLLHLIVLLKQGGYKAEFNKLYSIILAKMDKFTLDLQQVQISNNIINKLKYLICAAIDEALLNLESGAPNINNKSLVRYYYKEELGGEYFFELLEAAYNSCASKPLQQIFHEYSLDNVINNSKLGLKFNDYDVNQSLYNNPQDQLPLIYLAHLLLCLGFEGKYAIMQNGKEQLAEIKEKLRALLIAERPQERIQVTDEASRDINIIKNFKIQLGILLFLFITTYATCFTILHYKKLELYNKIVPGIYQAN